MAWKPAPQSGQDKLVLDIGDRDSTGEVGELLFGASMVLLSLPEESGESRKVEFVEVMAELALCSDLTDIGDSKDVSDFHDG